MSQIIWLITFSTILLTASINAFNCNDQCLLSKLKFLVLPPATNDNEQLIISSYDMQNNKFSDNALIWMNPSNYFSHSFMQTLTNSKYATDDDFRDTVYLQYISKNNIKLILEINIRKNKNDINDEYITNMLSKYRFDGLKYNENVFSPNMHRMLLSEFASNNDENLEFDILNQHTYDGYDWFLYVFTICVFGLICICCGWCGHKKYISDKIVDDKDIEDLATPIPPSGDVEKKYSFNGFNIFGENVAPENKHRNSYNEHVLSQTATPTLPGYESQIASEIDMTPMSSFNLSEPNTKRVTLSNSSITQSPTTTTMDIDVSPHTVTTKPVIYETNNVIVMQIETQPVINNIDQQQRVSVPRIALPAKNADIIPQYKEDPDMVSSKTAGIDGVAAPDSCEPSESHVTIDISYGGGTPSSTGNGSDAKNGSYSNLQNVIIEQHVEYEQDVEYDQYDQAQHQRVITAPIGLQVIME